MVGETTNPQGTREPKYRQFFNQEYTPSLRRLVKIFGNEIGSVIDMNLEL